MITPTQVKILATFILATCKNQRPLSYCRQMDKMRKNLYEKRNWHLNPEVNWPSQTIAWLTNGWSRSHSWTGWHRIFRDSTTAETNDLINMTINGNTVSTMQRFLLTEASPSSYGSKASNPQQEMDRSLRTVAHNLRAPLSSVLGLIDLVKQEDAKNGSPYNQYLDLMQLSIEKLDSTIKELLVSSQGDLREIRIERIDLPQLVQESLDKIRFMPGASGIDMHVDTDDNYPFYSDKIRVASILDNLIANAIKYRDPAKKVSHLHIYVNVRKANAEFKFRDNGIGIQREYLDKIFDRYFRATNSAGGTGLGLSFVKESVEKLNGSIDIKSRVGYGTTICLDLHNYVKDHPTGMPI